MIKKLLLGILLLSIATISRAQSLTIQAEANSARNGGTTFTLANGKASFSANQISFLGTDRTLSGFSTFGISGDRSVVALMEGTGSESKVRLFTSAGTPLITYDITSISASDPSVAVYPNSNGSLLVRDNIVNFSFYDSFGEIITNASGSSQSQGGESIAEVAMDRASQTVVIYTPKIKNDEALGSQAGYVDQNMQLQNFFYSTDRFIKFLEVSHGGKFITFVTADDQGEDRIHLADRYGNELSTLDTDENLQAVTLSKDAAFITANSSGRVLVYDSMSGERIGSTSFRSDVVKADYFPQDHTILAMTGSRDEAAGAISNVEFHAINIEERKVERKEYTGGSLGVNKALELSFSRLGTGQYLLSGTNRSLEILVSY